MTRTPLDWLDRLAVASVGGSRREAIAADKDSEGQFSRADAVKLAVGAAAALLLGLPGRAAAESPSALTTCLNGCATKYNAAISADVEACAIVFGGHTPTPSNGVRRLARFFIFGAPEALSGILFQSCVAGKVARRLAQHSGCEDHCRDTCAKSPQTCSPTTPPKSVAPAVPPPPNPGSSSDPCWACVKVGGACCPPCFNKGLGVWVADCLTVLTDGKTAGTCSRAGC